MARSELVQLNIVPATEESPSTFQINLRNGDVRITNLDIWTDSPTFSLFRPYQLNVIQLGILSETRRDIANMLSVSESTVKTYRTEIAKLLKSHAPHVNMWNRWLSGFAVVNDLISSEILQVVDIASTQIPELTQKQYDTSVYLASGCTNDDIATFRGISLRSAKDMVSKLYGASGLHGELYIAAFVRQCISSCAQHPFLEQYKLEL